MRETLKVVIKHCSGTWGQTLWYYFTFYSFCRYALMSSSDAACGFRISILCLKLRIKDINSKWTNTIKLIQRHKIVKGDL